MSLTLDVFNSGYVPVNGSPPGTSSTTNDQRRRRSSTCSTAATEPQSIWTKTGS